MFDSRPASFRSYLLLGLMVVASAGAGSLAWLLADEPAAPKTPPVAVAESKPVEPEFPAADIEFFETKVRPILVTKCGECHGAEIKEPKGGLRMHTRAAVLKGGDTKEAAVPGKPKESLLVDAINYGDLYQMPPNTKLPPEEIAVLTKWVELGLPWPKEAAGGKVYEHEFNLAARKAAHWAWHKQPYQIPDVKDVAWAKTAIDRFILAKLEAAKLKPADKASRETLLRRLSFDLTGLPPTPTELDEFLADTADPAKFAAGYEKAVDGLLRSPAFGERWARHWMDLVRYAESRGHEFDYNMSNVWHYRDYLIRAYNADVPYNDFVVEQVAGDLLPKPRLNPENGSNESLVATGFWFLGEWVHSPVDIRQDEMDRFDNQVDVFSKTFLGLTVSCARCHDHKFDAISQKDYYAIAGYLESSAFRMARFDTDASHREIAEQLAKLRAEATTETGKKLFAAYRATFPDGKIQKYIYWATLFVGKYPKQPLAELAAKLESYAQEEQLQAEHLGRWVEELRRARDDAKHPFHLLVNVALANPKAENLLPQLLEAGAKLKLPAPPAGVTAIVDFAALPDDQFRPDGVAFGLRPRRVGEFLLDPSDANLPCSVSLTGGAVRDPFWNGLAFSSGTQHDWGRYSGIVRAGQSIRTPTFVVDQPIWSLVAGEGSIVAVVCSHQLVEGPLHGGLNAGFKHEPSKFRWVRQDLSRYKGQRIHLEFAPVGNSPLAIRMVAQGPTQPLDPTETIHTEAAIARTNLLKEVDAPLPLDKLALVEVALIAKCLKDLDQKPLEPSSDPVLADWVVRNRDLFTSPDAIDVVAAKNKVAELAAAEKELAGKTKRDSRLTFAMWDGDPQDEFLLIRGNSRTPGALVPRGLPTAIYGEKQPNPADKSGRLEMAQRLVDASANPLIAKVYVNRIWHHLFGRGLVPSTDNFGVLGDKPTHPELLQYLADQFVAEGWSTKKMIKSLVMTNAYQMASTPNAAADEADPTNKLWHRANIRRLEGEAIRDSLLAISGRLDPTMFGQSVPVHLTDFMQGRGRPGQGPIDGNGRRSIYISIRRNFLSPMMLAFDTPIPFSTVGKRNVSNVPAQALILMNDQFVVGQAHFWARRSLDQSPKLAPAERIASLYRDAFARAPTAEETADALAFLEVQAEELKVPAERRAIDPKLWGDLCHVLINVKEFIYLP